jgi:hypothetical protein
MQRLPNVHPSNTILYPNGIGMFAVGAANEGSKILIYNASALSFQLDFLNGQTDTLHPWEANWWPLDGDTKQIQWAIDTDSLNVSTPPITTIFLTLYGAQEKLTGTYPVSLPYQTSLGGGQTSTNVTSTNNAIVNDGNTAGTSIIETTVVGKPSTTILTNDGILNLMTLIAGTLQQLIKTQAIGNPLLLGLSATITEVLGNLLVDGTLTVTGNSTLGGTTSLGITTVGGGLTMNGGDITMNSHNLVGPITMTGGVALTSGDCNLNGHQLQNISRLNFSSSGSFTAIGFGSGTGTGTYTHGAGVVPQWVGLSPHFVGSMTMGYDSETSTNVHVTCGAANAFVMWVERT